MSRKRGKFLNKIDSLKPVLIESFGSVIKTSTSLFAAIVFTFALHGCAVPLSSGGQQVREIDTTYANSHHCEFLGTRQLRNQYGATPSNCSAVATTKVLNAVAEAGGNAYVEQSRNSDLCVAGGTVITYEIWNCP